MDGSFNACSGHAAMVSWNEVKVGRQLIIHRGHLDPSWAFISFDDVHQGRGQSMSGIPQNMPAYLTVEWTGRHRSTGGSLSLYQATHR